MNTNIKDLRKDENTTIESSGFSIHTITLRCPFTNMERTLVKDKICMYCNTNRVKYYKENIGNNVYWNFDLRNELCINRVNIWDLYSEGILVKSGLDITINPRHFYHKDDHPFTYIADQNDLDSILIFLDILIKTLEIPLDTYMFQVHRIDFCANLELESRDKVENYMRIMRKGAYVYNGKRKVEYSKTQKKMVPTKHSFTIYGKSFEFAIYDKYKQMKSTNNLLYSDDLESGLTQIRFELRVKRSKEKLLEEKYRLYTIENVIKSIKEISEIELTKFIIKAFGRGTFVKYDIAKNTIKQSNNHSKTKEKMIFFMKIASKNNLEIAKLYFNSDYKKILKKFDYLGISPITLPSRSKDCLLYNPVQYLQGVNKCK